LDFDNQNENDLEPEDDEEELFNLFKTFKNNQRQSHLTFHHESKKTNFEKEIMDDTKKS